MFRLKTLIAGLLAVAMYVFFLVYDVSEVTEDFVRLELGTIGRSIYEAHRTNGRWPERIEDLEGTEYLNNPHRRESLQDGRFVIVWQQDLDSKPVANRGRVLAYDNSTMLSKFRKVWVSWGDLRVEPIDRDELDELLRAARE